MAAKKNLLGVRTEALDKDFLAAGTMGANAILTYTGSVP
jgi:hypothetical protein